MYKFLNFFILYILLSKTMVFAQKKEIGIDLGYGKANISIPKPSNYFLFGINYNYRPKQAPFSIKTAITYDFRGNNNINFNFIKLPVGIDFIIGRKVNIILGGSLYVSSLLFDNGTKNIFYYKESNYFLHLGGTINLGLGYIISDKIAIDLNFLKNYDFTDMYSNDCPSPSQCTQDPQGVDTYFKFGLKYCINNN